MKKIILAVLSAGMLLAACNSKKEDKKAVDAYQKVTMTVEEMEKKDPVRFLDVAGNDRKNILGQTVIRGSISNKARIVSYRDIEIKLMFYSKTGALLEEDRETIYETIAPGEHKSFKSKYFAAKGTDSVAMRVTGARIRD